VVFNFGFKRIVDDELAAADLTDKASFACGGLIKVIPGI
jgi:hypothetical protein